MTNPLRNIVRRIVLWACPGLRADTAGMRADLDIAHRTIAIARIEMAHLRTRLVAWETYTRQQTELVMTLLREVDACKVAAASRPAGYDARLAKIEMLIQSPVSDGVLELDEQAQAALSDALVGLSKGSA